MMCSHAGCYRKNVVRGHGYGPDAYGSAVSRQADEAPIHAEKFVRHAETRSMIPDAAIALFTQEEEELLLDPDIAKRPLSNDTNKRMVDYYARIYTTFYPEISFYLDWESLRPNVFAFTEYGRKTVVIGGEFLRIEPLYDAAMAVTLSFGVGALLGGNAGDAQLDHVGQALYFGMGVVMRQALPMGDTWNDVVLSGKAQLKTVFDAVIAKEGAASPLKCLREVMNAAVSGTELPVCAGGPVQNGLNVVSAAYDSVKQELTVKYNEAVSAYSANNVKNYAITPDSIAIDSAAIDKADAASVVLAVELTTNTYKVAVRNVRASDGSTLDPKASTATFTVEALEA